MQKISTPLHLEGMGNVRELGFYHNREGKPLKQHSVLRSDALHELTVSDGEYLSEYGVRCVIDLRFPEEQERFPDRLDRFKLPVRYTPISLQTTVREKRYSSEFPPSMWELYHWILEDSQVEFCKIFQTISEFPDECVLFHCTGGKDRTGVLAMLLLKLADVDDETVVGDYAFTQEAMKERFILQTKDLESRGFTVPRYVMESPPENMEKTLHYLAEHYGTAADYLAHIGLPLATIRTIRNKLLNVSASGTS